MSDDPEIRIPLLAVALGKSEQSVKLDVIRGLVPRPKSPPAIAGRLHVWPLSVLRAWRPEIARRIVALLNTLENFPPDAA